MKRYFLFISFLLLTFHLRSQNSVNPYRKQIDLKGNWQFALDTAKIGIPQKWFTRILDDSVLLPGTTDTNRKGFRNHETTTMHLNRVYKYEGAAWYRRKVVIPADFKNKHIQLFLERTKPSKVWIDDKLVGESMLLQSPQQFDLSQYLSPGEHYITICIDNSLKLTPYGNVHIYSDDTETNWNGIIGKLYLEATSSTYISNLQVFPDVDHKKINVKLELENPLHLKTIDIDLLVTKAFQGKEVKLKPKKITKAYMPVIMLEYDMASDCSLWDEYQQPLYQLTAVISGKEEKDSQTVPFGMRSFVAKGTQFNINGRTTFLRGKHEACVFPLTGHPPMDAEGWARVFRIAKSYGINHYRFHSYCPPEAAFTAADQEGIYIQAELPFWGGLNSDTTAAMLKDEGMAMLKAYANHPSFVMFSAGNEIWGGHEKVEKNMVAMKQSDNRVLYAMGSNNNIGYVPPRDYCDYFIGARIPGSDSSIYHTRLTHAFADAREGGILNTHTPSTETNFSYAVSQIKIPIVSHEIGQYQIYPDYNEIKKYTGVLKANNLEVFRDKLNKAGMLDQDIDFQKASGAWSALCYKAEMEAALRTKGLGGFQLLDLQDFPGQGTALVGILDAFMDSKNVISPETWKQSCNDVVLLAEFPKYCYTNRESFRAKVLVANYSNQQLKNDLQWDIKNNQDNVLSKGTFSGNNIASGTLQSVGDISFELANQVQAEKLSMNISLKGTGYSNTYPLWIFPEKTSAPELSGIEVTDKLTGEAMSKLHSGAKVLLFPRADDVKDNSVGGLFPPEFWNWEMFKGISEWAKKPVSPGTLGILTNPAHPLFNAFPTDFHTNWQWFSIIKASHPLILDNTATDFSPIVQVIDNLQRNHKLGLVFEFKVGEGKLLVCMSPLNKMTDKPEAKQLYESILKYMKSGDFKPVYELSGTEQESLFGIQP